MLMSMPPRGYLSRSGLCAPAGTMSFAVRLIFWFSVSAFVSTSSSTAIAIGTL